jgi:hypothetical protein
VGYRPGTIFGERWGRHWLDVVGYTDTVGFDVDADQIIEVAMRTVCGAGILPAELAGWKPAPQLPAAFRGST